MTQTTRRKMGFLEGMSMQVAKFTGSSAAFALALGIIVVWGLTGPLFGYSDTWQLVINTGTTIVTFLMVFLIQRSQNKDALAIQLKLNELIAAIDKASNRLVDVESLCEADIHQMHKHYHELAALAAKEAEVSESHSLHQAAHRHAHKDKITKSIKTSL